VVPVTGYENGGRGGNGVQLFLEGKRGSTQLDSTVPEVDDTTKSCTAVEEAKGGK
jgi:hypothetical protein